MNFKEISDESSLFATFVFTNEHEIHYKGAQRVCSSGLLIGQLFVCSQRRRQQGLDEKLKLSYICKQ